MLSRCQL